MAGTNFFTIALCLVLLTLFVIALWYLYIGLRYRHNMDNGVTTFGFGQPISEQVAMTCPAGKKIYLNKMIIMCGDTDPSPSCDSGLQAGATSPNATSGNFYNGNINDVTAQFQSQVNGQQTGTANVSGFTINGCTDCENLVVVGSYSCMP